MESNDINAKRVLVLICLIVLIVVSLYIANFHHHISDKNEAWGTFGDYVGGVLNPVIAIGALYLIAQTYILQKNELSKTIELLKVSTDAQDKQIILAALTALLNSTLMKISILKTENISFSVSVEKNTSLSNDGNDDLKAFLYNQTKSLTDDIVRNGTAINKHNDEVTKLEERINSILNDS